MSWNFLLSETWKLSIFFHCADKGFSGRLYFQNEIKIPAHCFFLREWIPISRCLCGLNISPRQQLVSTLEMEKKVLSTWTGTIRVQQKEAQQYQAVNSDLPLKCLVKKSRLVRADGGLCRSESLLKCFQADLFKWRCWVSSGAWYHQCIAKFLLHTVPEKNLTIWIPLCHYVSVQLGAAHLAKQRD